MSGAGSMRVAAISITKRDGDGIARAQALLDGLAGQSRLPPDPVADMHVALDEVLSNILRNGFADGRPHRIKVRLSVDGPTITAEIEDDCAPFDPLAVPEPNLRQSLQERPVGGLGIHFVRKLMSEVGYVRADERNRLLLKLRLAQPATK